MNKSFSNIMEVTNYKKKPKEQADSNASNATLSESLVRVKALVIGVLGFSNIVSH